MLKKTNYVGTVGMMFDNNPPRYFVNSYKDMMRFSRKYLCPENTDIKEVNATVSWHEMGRNQLVEEAEGEWLFMTDTDHMFMPDLLARLLRVMCAYQIDVVSGIYQFKQPEMLGAPVVNMYDKNKQLVQLKDWDKDLEAIRVASVGGGCLLIKTKVLKRIKRELGKNPFDLVPGLSEDYSFCHRCTQLDIPIYLAPRIESHHTTTNVLSIKDYKPQ